MATQRTHENGQTQELSATETPHFQASLGRLLSEAVEGTGEVRLLYQSAAGETTLLMVCPKQELSYRLKRAIEGLLPREKTYLAVFYKEKNFTVNDMALSLSKLLDSAEDPLAPESPLQPGGGERQQLQSMQARVIELERATFTHFHALLNQND